MGLFSWLREAQREGLEAEKRRGISNAVGGIIACSLTCRKCNNLAVPVLGTDSHYVCIKCENRFTGAKHRLGQSLERQRYQNGSSTSEYVYNYPYYNSAVDYIKNNNS
jgi:hypothetical protein